MIVVSLTFFISKQYLRVWQIAALFFLKFVWNDIVLSQTLSVLGMSSKDHAPERRVGESRASSGCFAGPSRGS